MLLVATLLPVSLVNATEVGLLDIVRRIVDQYAADWQ